MLSSAANLLRLRALNFDWLAVDFVLLAHDLIDWALLLEGDETKSTRSLSVAVEHDNGVRDPSVGFEVASEVILRYGWSEATNEDLAGLETASSSVLTVGCTGMGLFPWDSTLDLHSSSIDRVGLRDDIVDHGRVFVSDEAKSTWLSSELVLHESTVRELAVSLKVGSQTSFGRLPRNTSDEKLSRSRSLVHFVVDVDHFLVLLCGELCSFLGLLLWDLLRSAVLDFERYACVLHFFLQVELEVELLIKIGMKTLLKYLAIYVYSTRV